MTSIGDAVFYNCTGLTSITIPEAVKSIGNYAFRKCIGLTAIYSINPTPPTVVRCFDNSHYQNATLYVPQDALEAYKAAEGWKYFLNMQDLETTEIESVKTDAGRQKDVYYDLNGRRLNAPRKGLNIINGKKVIIR